MSSPLPAHRNVFAFEVENDSPTGWNFVLPAIDTLNFTVDWGDGTSNVITLESDPNLTHTYAAQGPYTVSMWGECHGFSFKDVNTSATKLRFIREFVDMGFQVLNFKGCTSLIEIHNIDDDLGNMKSIKNIKSLLTADDMFEGCTGLITLPPTIFYGSPLLSSFKRTFLGCTNLEAIPRGLFRYQTAVTTFEDCFGSCDSITSIPEGLFDNVTALIEPVSGFLRTFAYCGCLETIPSSLFRYCTTVQAFDSTFMECGVSIPHQLLTFPADLFKYCTANFGFIDTFKNCTNLETIPLGLMNLPDACVSFVGMFNGCVAAAGNAPELWNRTSTPLAYTDCFKGCTGLTNYASIPNSWKGL